MSGKKYFPKNWEEYATAPAEYFDTCTFEEFMTWKIANWEIPSSVACVIRVRDHKNNKVTEHTYMRRSAAEAKVAQLLKLPHVEFTVCDHETIHHLSTKNPHDKENT